MATEAVKESGKQAESAAGTFAILFELENVAAGGRHATFQALKRAFNDIDAKLTPSDFARHALQPTPELCVEALIQAVDAKESAQDKVTNAVKSSVADYFHGKADLNAGLDKLLSAAASQSIAVAAISSLSEEASDQLMARLQLADRGTKLLVVKDLEKGYPRADSWLKAAKQISRAPRNCIVVATCQTACKSALNAGMRCIVVPDEYTAHQDFSGADVVLENWEEMSPKEILAALIPDA